MRFQAPGWIGAALLVANWVSASPALAACATGSIPQFNYQTKQSDCVRVEQGDEVNAARQKRQKRQPRHLQALLQRQRQLERQQIAAQRQTVRAQQATQNEMRRRLQEIQSRQRQLIQRQNVALQQQLARQRRAQRQVQTLN